MGRGRKVDRYCKYFRSYGDGEQGRLTITVSDVDEGRPAAGTDYADNLEIRTEILALVNQVRQEYGQSAAPADQSLMDAAQDYATRRNTWHDSQEECELVLAHGYPYGFSCNLTVFTSVSAEDVAKTAVKNWVNSLGHLRAMLDPKADSLGVGVVRYEGVTYCYLFVGMSGTHQSIRIIPQTRKAFQQQLGGFFLTQFSRKGVYLHGKTETISCCAKAPRLYPAGADLHARTPAQHRFRGRPEYHRYGGLHGITVSIMSLLPLAPVGCTR